MKARFLITLSVCVSFVVAAQNSTRADASIVAGKFFLNKREISKDWKFSTLKVALGSPDRYTEGTNKVYLYDAQGIVVYEMKKNGNPTDLINELSIYFSIKESNVLIPHSTYTGSFNIEGVNITNNSKWENIGDSFKIKGYKKKGDYSYIKNGTYIIFRFLDNGQLENISVGKG